MKKSVLFFFIVLLASSTAFGQCFPERHNSSLKSGWLSCIKTLNPNPNRQSGHWILFELEERQAINSVKIWNINHPDFLNSGTKTLEIDYMADNGQWTTYAINTVPRAEASGFYEGVQLSLPGEFVTDKILFNLTENYGNNCSGLAEVKIGLIDKTTATFDIDEDHFDIMIAPNPFSDFASVTIRELENSTIRYEIVNNLGEILTTKELKTLNGQVNFEIRGSQLPPGTYHLNIKDGLKVSSRKLSINR